MRATEGAEETNYRNKEQREQRTQKRREHHRKTWAERDSGTRTVKREEDRKGRRDGGHRTHALTDSEVTNRMSHGQMTSLPITVFLFNCCYCERCLGGCDREPFTTVTAKCSEREGPGQRHQPRHRQPDLQSDLKHYRAHCSRLILS